jgi:hypothetical protein
MDPGRLVIRRAGRLGNVHHRGDAGAVPERGRTGRCSRPGRPVGVLPPIQESTLKANKGL